MNFIKRALKSTWSKKGRTILLLAVFSAILIFVFAGLTIRSAALSATNEAKKSVGATVTLSANREAAFKQQKNSSESERPDPGSFSLTPVSLEDAQKIATLSGVKTYSFESSASAMAGSNITPISSNSTENTEDTSTSDEPSSKEDSPEEGQGFPGGGEMMGGGMTQSDFQISGVSATAQESSFNEGTSTIIDGQGITEEDLETNNVVIETSLAQANELAVGDSFTLTNPDDEDTSYNVTVKGIYQTTDSGNSMGMRFNFLNPSNTIYAAYTLANTMNGADSENTIDSAVYTLNDPQEMDSFVSDAEKLIDTESFTISSNDQAYQQMLQPLNNVADFSKNIVLLVTVAGVIILTLIVMMTIRERRFEIGVLLSLGEARTKVILQFFTEMAICMIFALGIAGVSGNLVANLVGQQLIDQQTKTAQNDTQPDQPNQGEGGPSSTERGGFGGQQGNPFEVSDEVSELDIQVHPKEFGLLAVFAFLISLFSVFFASIGILKMNPKKILIS